MTFDRLAAHLDGLMSALAAWLASVGEGGDAAAASWWNTPYAPGKWTRLQLAGHLIDSAANNHQRFVRALLTAPGEMFIGPGYDQEGLVRVERFDAEAPALVCGLLLHYNRHLAHLFAHFPAASLDTLCRIGGDPPIPLAKLALDYVAHLEHHLRQLTGPDEAAAARLPFSGLPWPPSAG